MAEHCDPNLEEEFTIFRFKKIIEDQIAEKQDEGNGILDVVSEISFQNNYKNF